MNHKDERIKKLWQSGLKDPFSIAKKLGYDDNNIEAGIERVREALVRLGL